MTFLEALRPAESRASIESPLVPLSSPGIIDFLGLTGTKTTAGQNVTADNSLGMMAVWRAVNLIAGTSASLPLHAYRNEDDIRVPASGRGSATKLLRDPHPDLTAFEFWEIAYARLLLWGNSYSQKLYNEGGQLAELWPLDPAKMQAGRASDRTKVYVYDGDTSRPLTDREIFHIPGFGYDGVQGLSVISLAREGIGLAKAAEEYGAKLFGSGSLHSGILTVDRQLTEPQATALKTQWRTKMGGGNKNAHEVAILDNGAKFQQMSMPPEDAQFIESRRFQIAEVARMFGVPPHMLFETDKSTTWGSGIESQGLGFVIYTLRPWLTRVEQRVTKLIRPEPVYARYAVEGLLRGDSIARSEFYTKLFNLGVFSTNEIRRLEDLPPVADGDVRYRPLNMGILGQADPTPAAPPSAAVPTTQGVSSDVAT